MVLMLALHRAEQFEVVDKVAAGKLDLDRILAELDRSPPEDMLQWLEVDIPGTPTGDKLVGVAEDKPVLLRRELRHI
jgi:hypothetical protein